MNEFIAQHLTDSRRGKNTQLPLADLLRQSVYSRIAAYEDVNDAERLSQDPTFRLIGSEKTWDRGYLAGARIESSALIHLHYNEQLWPRGAVLSRVAIVPG